MAHIDHAFEMSGEPAAAQTLFLNQVGPELAKAGEFELVGEHPGELVFSDALNEAEMFEDEASARRATGRQGDEEQLTDLASPSDISTLVGANLPPGGRVPLVNPGDSLLAKHLHVEFEGGPDGTAVRIHGHTRRDLRDALLKLGSQGHWPETSDLPHD